MTIETISGIKDDKAEDFASVGEKENVDGVRSAACGILRIEVAVAKILVVALIMLTVKGKVEVAAQRTEFMNLAV